MRLDYQKLIDSRLVILKKLNNNDKLVVRGNNNMYNIFELCSTNLTLSGAFGQSAFYIYTKKELVIYLDGLIAGLSYKNYYTYPYYERD